MLWLVDDRKLEEVRKAEKPLEAAAMLGEKIFFEAFTVQHREVVSEQRLSDPIPGDRVSLSCLGSISIDISMLGMGLWVKSEREVEDVERAFDGRKHLVYLDTREQKPMVLRNVACIDYGKIFVGMTAWCDKNKCKMPVWYIPSVTLMARSREDISGHENQATQP